MRKRLVPCLALVVISGFTGSCKKEETTAAGGDPCAEKVKAAVARLAPPADTIPVDVRLKFTGIVHLVGDSASERLIVIPNLTAATHPHTPYILVRSRDFNSDLPNGPTKQDGTNIHYKYKELTDRFMIDVQNSTGWDAAANAKFYSVEAGDPTEPCPKNGVAPTRSLHWLPRLSVVSRTAGAKVHTKFTMANPNKNDVIAQLGIKDGSIGGNLSAELPQRLYKFAFRDGGSRSDDHTQAVASYLVYTFKVNLPRANPWFTLKGVTFRDGGGGGGTPVDLGKFEANNGEIEIVIGNIILNDFFKPQLATSHFDHYYLAYDESTVHVTRTQPERGELCSDGASSDVECGPDRLP